uniref:FAS-associated factor 1-like n=1 Tax=Sinocyclocheilus anshuiensis TaxID=1608454 RepID=A0A671P2W6_9TELE
MDREMILADFQACTGIDNIAEAITLLELNNWDLVAAINGVIPQENGILQRYDVDLLILMNLKPSTQAFLLQDNAPPSSASPSRHIVERQSRMLSFRVEYRQRSTEVVLEDASTVGDIKSILETELQVPVSKMQLKGWKSGDVSDSTVLQSLHLPKNNSLYVLTPDIAPSASTSQSSAQQGLSSQNYLLVISHREAQRDYSLHFPASKTIQEVKRNISDLTNIPVRHQQWDGWPASASDDSVCFLLSLLVFFFFYPVTIVHLNGVYWIICIDIFLHLPSVPENSENEGDALLHFTAEFSRRYGDCHPVFYIGSLEAASQEAFYGKARDRKLLAIYLHNDESVLSNVFCSQMMCADSIVSYLSQNFITWAWDVTKEANKARLLTMCTRHFGSVVAQTIRTYKTDQFPLLLIVMGKRTSNEVLNVIQGNTTVDELMMRLMGAMEIFTAQQQEDIKDEDEREAREMVKREQDEAYRLSLEADRKKREAQEREEAEQVRQERIRKEQEEEREAIRLSLEQALPPEPKEEGGEPISKLRIRTPSGKFLERQFLGSCKLQVLFDFVASKGYPSDEFKLLTTFPRRNITQIDPAWSLVEAKLFPQETLFLEAKE